MFSVTRKDSSTIISIAGIKIKLTSGLRIEHDLGGPYGMYDLVKAHAHTDFCVKSVFCQHGWVPMNHVVPSDLAAPKKLMLCWSKRYADICREAMAVPCKIVGAPFVHHRRALGIAPSFDAIGTIAFPAHAIRVARPLFDIEKYCALLQNLPDKFQPVTICLHYGDIIYHKLDEVYHSLGFKTVCAGMDNNVPFYQKFYRLLSQHRYATSNTPGSYTFYSVEMGIPFFLHGEIPVEDNTNGEDPDMPAELLTIDRYPSLQKSYELFGARKWDEVTDEQRAFVLSELGIEDCLAPADLALALRIAALEEHNDRSSKLRNVFFLKKLLRHPLCASELLRFHAFLRESAVLLHRQWSRAV